MKTDTSKVMLPVIMHWWHKASLNNGLVKNIVDSSV